MGGCKEKYDSPVPPIETGYLVVEGVINNDGDTTDIKLSRTTNLGDTGKRVETGAVVTIEGTDASIYRLGENFAGNYTINNIHLDNSIQYRINIQTSNNQQYRSDFVSVRSNPPIDSITWARENNGVQIYINTHDPQNNTRYYQWEFEETWEFNTFFATLKFVGNPASGVAYRDVTDPKIYQCWQFDYSKTLLLGSSAKLSDDVIHLPLTFVPGKARKMSVLYSIRVKQYSWSKEGYEFLERMKKNTESVGSVFDAQPSELNTNIHCITNPGQQVVGFFNICNIEEKRIFISNNDLPGWDYRLPCAKIVVPNNPDSIKDIAYSMLPVSAREERYPNIISFYAAESPCVDCRLTGTNIKPNFWP